MFEYINTYKNSFFVCRQIYLPILLYSNHTKIVSLQPECDIHCHCNPSYSFPVHNLKYLHLLSKHQSEFYTLQLNPESSQYWTLSFFLALIIFSLHPLQIHYSLNKQKGIRVSMLLSHIQRKALPCVLPYPIDLNNTLVILFLSF